MKVSIVLASILFALTGCQNQNPPEANQAETLDGKSLFGKYCQSCHNADTPIGPPLFAIKKHYQEKYPEKEAFSIAITAFVQHPTMETAELTHAVEKFGLMPALNYSSDELMAIAGYIYDHEFSHPKHGQNKKGNNDDLSKLTPMERGKHYAKSTKAQLGKNLMASLNKHGASEALAFCNTRAIPITDSMATHFDVLIQRVSDKPRNPSNTANAKERKILKTYQEQLVNGEDLKPELSKEGDMFQFYAPITTNQMCLQCHGAISNQILPETKANIDKLYPTDQATGYSENQVRGIWKIQFKE